MGIGVFDEMNARLIASRPDMTAACTGPACQRAPYRPYILNLVLKGRPTSTVGYSRGRSQEKIWGVEGGGGRLCDDVVMTSQSQ